ncbi:DUF998 domain-containing protein [Thermoactinospora rubra]|uniref:DUF998 domain-containing protein n=1 Tax=Thermoactinospora rubra TaxID=1088767 RepID=UPI000A114779|nr:DUF998 domain-containing protein [Thermoactinospora rubra]
MRKTDRVLLGCGVVAGPLFVGVTVAQILTRRGFDLRRAGISSLSLGELGWIQIANFVLAGALAVACAAGMRAVLRGGRGGTWGPPLVALFGVALVVAGLFTTDPTLGFPPEAPFRGPPTLSRHAVVHNVASSVAPLALAAACLVLLRRLAVRGGPGWVVYSLVTGLVIPVLSLWPGYEGAGVRLLAVAVLAAGWLSATALVLLRGARATRHT